MSVEKFRERLSRNANDLNDIANADDFKSVVLDMLTELENLSSEGKQLYNSVLRTRKLMYAGSDTQEYIMSRDFPTVSKYVEK